MVRTHRGRFERRRGKGLAREQADRIRADLNRHSRDGRRFKPNVRLFGVVRERLRYRSPTPPSGTRPPKHASGWTPFNRADQLPRPFGRSQPTNAVGASGRFTRPERFQATEKGNGGKANRRCETTRPRPPSPHRAAANCRALPPRLRRLPAIIAMEG